MNNENSTLEQVFSQILNLKYSTPTEWVTFQKNLREPLKTPREKVAVSNDYKRDIERILSGERDSKSTRWILSPPSDDESEEEENIIQILQEKSPFKTIRNPSCENTPKEILTDEVVWKRSPLLQKLETELKRNRMQARKEFTTVLENMMKNNKTQTDQSVPSGWKHMVEEIEQRNKRQAAAEEERLQYIEKELAKQRVQNREMEKTTSNETKKMNAAEHIDKNEQLSKSDAEKEKVSSVQTSHDTFTNLPKTSSVSAKPETNALHENTTSVLTAKKQVEETSQKVQAKNENITLKGVDVNSPYKETMGYIGTIRIVTSASAMSEVSTYRSLLEEERQRASSFIKDPAAASFRMHLKKRINLAANQIAASQKQILNKARDIVETLQKAGQSSKEAQSFCILCTVERLVEEGERQVALHSDSAFSIAAVIIAVTAEFPYLRQLFLAQFHQVCIFTIPAYAVRSKEESVETFWQTMGWKQAETVDRFFERMSGYISLFAAVLQTQLPSLAINLFGLESAWTWLARVLNMKPRRFTAFILISFLDIAGYALWRKYSKQFDKMLRLIHDYVLPHLPKTTSPGPTARLQSYIVDYFTNRTIKEPQGRQLPVADAENEDT
eukprot:jgi/Galph1/3491/GphlegSOOS_G2138.1